MAHDPNIDPRIVEAMEVCRPGSDDVADPAMESLRQRLSDSPEIAKTLKAVAQTAEETRGMIKELAGQLPPAVANANAMMKDIQKLVQNLDSRVTTLLPAVEGTMKDAQKLVQHIDGRIDPIATNAEEALRGVNGLVNNVNGLVNNDVKKLVGNLDQQVGQVMPEIAKSLVVLRATLQEAQVALRSVGGTTGGDSPLMYRLTETLEEVSKMAQSLRVLTDYIEQHPESFIRGKMNP